MCLPVCRVVRSWLNLPFVGDIHLVKKRMQLLGAFEIAIGFPDIDQDTGQIIGGNRLF